MEERLMPKNSLSLLVAHLVEKNHLDEATADKFIRNLLEVINIGIQQDKLVKIKGWGTLKVISVRDRESVDVNTGERIVIEGRDKLNFTPDAVLREIVNKPFEQFETVIVNDGVDFTPVDQEFLDSLPSQSSSARQEEPKDIKEDENEKTNPSVVSTEATDKVTDQIPEQTEQSVPSEENTTLKVSEAKQSLQDGENSSDNAPENNISENDTPEDNTSEEMEEEQSDHLVSTPVAETPSVKEENDHSLDQEQPSIEKTKTETLTADIAAVDNLQQESSESASDEKEETKEEEKKEKAAEEEEKSAKEEEDNSLVVDGDGEKASTVKVFPRYLIFITGFLFLVLIGGLVGLSYNYGRLVSECNQMALKLHNMENTSAGPVKVLKTKAKPHSENPVPVPEVQKEKATSPVPAKQSAPNVKQTTQSDTKQKTISAVPSSGAYDSDPRVRTGAYRIVGIEKVITVHKGQTLSGLSQAYLGKGMECYVEAVNGIKEVNEGQKLRIPKLELKKKK
ncbi:MAG: HU family DNA-binding protein [Prevotella sp.]|nr:HU family DNA-binding protein [Prevotella sp.]